MCAYECKYPHKSAEGTAMLRAKVTGSWVPMTWVLVTKLWFCMYNKQSKTLNYLFVSTFTTWHITDHSSKQEA